MQITRAPVVSQPAPGCQHRLLFCARQPIRGWKLRDEFFIPVFYYSNTGLLQHDFRDQNAVRIIFTAPRQLALVPVIPAQQKTPEPPCAFQVDGCCRSSHAERF
jgi:hypothetical protein